MNLTAVFRFLVPFGLYLITLTGSYLADDSPETIYDIAALEHQHPPGYPLITLVGRLAALVPVGGFAFRINLLSAVLVALGCVQVGRLADRFANRTAGTAAALLAGLGHTAWSQAISAKGAVYGLNAVLVLELIRLATDRKLTVRTTAIAGLFAGLGLANHWMTVIVALIGIVIGMLVGAALQGGVKIGDSIRGKPLCVGMLWLCLGASPYLLLPIRSHAEPPLVLNWGRPETVRQFGWHVSRAHYTPIEAGTRPEGYWPIRVWHLGSVALREWSWAGLPVALWGAGRLVVRSAGLAGPAAAAGAALVGAVLLVSHPPLEKMHITEPYLLPVWLLLAAGGGVALATVLSTGIGRIVVAIWAIVHLALAGGRLDASRYYVSYDYGWNLLQGAPKDAVMLAETDYDLFSLLEHHGVERRRPDITVAAAVFLDYDWYRETAHRVLPEVIPREHEIGEYVVKPVRPLVYTSERSGGDGVLRPVGLVMRPPLGAGFGLEDSARVWRALRFRGIWESDPDRYRLAQYLHISYGSQMLRFAAAARESDPALALVAYRKAARYPLEPAARLMARYAAAQLILGRLPATREARAAALASAAGELNAIIAEEPRFWRAHMLRGNILYLAGDRAGARESLNRALALLPPEAPDHARIVKLLRGL